MRPGYWDWHPVLNDQQGDMKIIRILPVVTVHRVKGSPKTLKPGNSDPAGGTGTRKPGNPKILARPEVPEPGNPGKP